MKKARLLLMSVLFVMSSVYTFQPYEPVPRPKVRELLEAILIDDTDQLRELLAAGGPASGRDNRGDSLLHNAAINSRYQAVYELIDAGADVYARGQNDATPLHLAALVGDANSVRALLGARAYVGARDRFGKTPLHDTRSAAVVQELLWSGADPNMSDYDGHTPLHSAAGRWRYPEDPFSEDQFEVVRLLLDAGADPYVQCLGGNTPLHEATSGAVVDALLARGVDVDTPSREGDTPLHTASNAEVIAALLRAGADVNACNDEGDTPLQTAAFFGPQETLEERTRLLLEAGAQPGEQVCPSQGFVRPAQRPRR